MRTYPTFVRVATFAFVLTGCVQAVEPTSNSTDEPAPVEEKPGPAPTVDCDPGGMYTCDCGDGNLGNKFCAWTGNAFSECMLCGNGSDYVKNTGIACDTNPPPGVAPTPCPALPDGCISLVCYSKQCWETTALPRTILVDTASGDCAVRMCDGSGNAVSVPDPGDCAGACDASGSCVQ